MWSRNFSMNESYAPNGSPPKSLKCLSIALIFSNIYSDAQCTTIFVETIHTDRSVLWFPYLKREKGRNINCIKSEEKYRKKERTKERWKRHWLEITKDAWSSWDLERSEERTANKAYQLPRRRDLLNGKEEWRTKV